MMAEHPDLARGRPQQVAHGADQGRLPRAVGPEQPEEGPVRDVEIEALDGGESAAVRLRQAAHRQCRHSNLLGRTGNGAAASRRRRG